MVFSLMWVFSRAVALTELSTSTGEQGLHLQRLIPPESADLDPSAQHTTQPASRSSIPECPSG